METLELQNMLWKPESELIEFKRAENDYDLWKICDYVSAIANEANLAGLKEGYFILWVEPKQHQAYGTNYRINNVQSAKREIFENTAHSVSIEEHIINDKRIVVFIIPAWPKNTIIYSRKWIAWWREDESLAGLSDIKRQEIISRELHIDWSKVIVPEATIDDLDYKAIEKARANFIEKSKIPEEEILSWTHIEFLNRSHITENNSITRSALILLWKESSSHKIWWISQLTWVLRDKDNVEKDYEHFYPPFILSVENIFHKIRNLRYRYLQEGTIFPDEVDMYDSWVLRELLHNCIAHQDYEKNCRINLVEYEDGRLIFDNIGSFIPETIDALLESESPPKKYRNPHLSKAMFHIGMIDTAWSGIKRVFKTQRERFFPLPSYNFEQDSVKVELYGKILDMKYANTLAQHTDLTLKEIIILDKVQKKKVQELDKTWVQKLKKRWLIEWRYPNVYIGSDISGKIWKKTEYMKLKWFDDEYYAQMILEYLEKYKKAHKQEIKDLLWNKLPDILTEKQKEDKINNLLNSKLSREWRIESIQWQTKAKKDKLWILKK